MPMTQMPVMARITATVRPCRIQALAAQLSSPTASRPKFTATSASEPMTRTPVMAMAQPPSQPAHGPMARVTHEKVVPQSWSTLLR